MSKIKEVVLLKIEKISENKVKFLLNQVDLMERNIKISDLAYGSEKTQALFREMMEQAVMECGFEVENAPLMIEAIPVSPESIMIIVSKVDGSADLENKFNLLPQTKDTRKFKKSASPTHAGHTSTYDDKNISVYSFDTLDDVTNASVRLFGYFNGTNFLYKNQKRYFLILQNDNSDDKVEMEELETVLSEYGQKHASNVVSKYYLKEHGELLINDSAIRVLATHLK